MTLRRHGLVVILISFFVLILPACQLRGSEAQVKDEPSTSEKMSFWLKRNRRGANFFNKVELRERFEAAKAAGIEVIRLAPNKWLNGRPAAEVGNFLLGPPSQYSGIIAVDLEFLKTMLNEAEEAGLKVVLTMLSLPGHRWSQHNGNTQERRLWQNRIDWDQAIQFWQDMANNLKSHPAIVGYNILNEPSPELVAPRLNDWYTGDYIAWYNQVKGTAADLNLFYKRVVQAIRTVDQNTPIVLDSGFYATPWAFKILEPIDDPNILYAFHMYEPYQFTNHKNKGRYSYPGNAPIGELESSHPRAWDASELSKFFDPVRTWQAKYNIPSNQIFAAEFGVYRRNPGAPAYLKDLISIFNQEKWHWAFYSFREDDWEGMDYELGSKPPPPEYWEYIEQGRLPGNDVYGGSAIFDAIHQGLTAPR